MTLSGKNQAKQIFFRKAALSIIDGAFYGNTDLPFDREKVLKELEELVDHAPGGTFGLSLLMGFSNLFPIFRYGRTFTMLPPEKRFQFIKGLTDSKFRILRGLGVLCSFPFKLAFARLPEVHEAMSIPYHKEKVKPEPDQRWMKQIFPASSFDADETIEADVVVVGTGAGGAVVAKELAEKGLAVAIIEEGNFYRRDVFTGNPKDMMPMLYRSGGLTATLGNAIIPIQMGKAVGGTTLINSGTCFRTPDEVLNRWVASGLTDFTPEKMAPYFQKVEEHLHVMECEAKYIGPIGEIIKKGCDSFGYSCGPLKHNIIDCDGQGICTQGCTKDAKQSTNLSYIPKALSAAAQLFTGFAAKDILTNGERAIGIKACGIGKNGKEITLTCYAKAVILSCGAFITPTVIQKNKLVRGNKWVGKNLTIHPAVFVSAIFPGLNMKNPETIPQGYMIDHFHNEGIMFEGGTPPFSIIAGGMPGVGKEYIDLVKSYHNMALFGCMVKDTSKGFVRPGSGNTPLIFYWLNKQDTEKLVKGMQILGEIFFAAGAKKLFLGTFDHPFIENPDELKKLKERKLKPMDLILTAFHAVGTAKIGMSNKDSVVDTNHQCHSVPGLFVVDASALPTSLGVNPQETIMATATRAAEKIAQLLEV